MTRSGPPAARGRGVASRQVLVSLLRFAESSDSIFVLVELHNRDAEGHALLSTADDPPLLVAEARLPRTASWHSPGLAPLYDNTLAPGQKAQGWLRFDRLGDDFAESTAEHRLRLAGFDDIVFEPRDLPVDPRAGPDLARAAALSPPDRSETPATALEEAVGALLEQQARAMERLDFTSYLETIHPEAREQEREVFERLRSFDLDEVTLALRSRLPDDPDRQRLSADVELSYRVAELPDDHRFTDRLSLQLAREGGRWLVRTVQADPRGLLFWRRGPIVLHRSTHFLLYTRPRLQGDLDRIAGEAEAGYLQILQAGLPLSGKYLALVPTRREFDQVTGAPGALGAARSISVREGERFSVLNRVFLLNGELFTGRRRLPELRRRQTIAHELVHLALAELNRAHTPPWLSEGTAVHFSASLDFPTTQRLVESGLESFSLAQMSQGGSLGEHVSDVGLAYVYAGATVEHLVRHHGKAKLLALYRHYAELAPSARPLTDTNDALASIYRFDLHHLDSEIKTALRRRHP